MRYNLEIYAKRDLIKAFKDYFKSFGDNFKLKTWATKKNNFEQVLKGIKYEGYQYFNNSDSAYKDFAKKVLIEYLMDRDAYIKDKLEKEKNIDNMSENIEIKKFNEYLQPINEMNIPVLKLDELMDSVPQGKPGHKYILSNRYKVPNDYIDVVNVKKHQYKVNDMRGDIMGNARVTFDVYVFNNEDINKINDNIIDYCVNDFMEQLPENLNIFGIDISPISFIEKETLKETFKQMISQQKTIDIISSVTGYDFDIKVNDFYIWSNKNKISPSVG